MTEKKLKSSSTTLAPSDTVGPWGSKRCEATAQSTGNQCGNSAMQYSKVCRRHGGKTPSNLKAAERKRLTVKINGVVEKRGWEPVTDPYYSISMLAGEIHAFKDILREKINEIEEWEYSAVDQVQYIRPLLEVYTQSLDRCQKIDADMIRLGLDAEKLKQAAERPSAQQAATLGRVLSSVLDKLELTQAQRSRVPVALREALFEQRLLPGNTYTDFQ